MSHSFRTDKYERHYRLATFPSHRFHNSLVRDQAPALRLQTGQQHNFVVVVVVVFPFTLLWSVGRAYVMMVLFIRTALPLSKRTLPAASEPPLQSDV